MYKCEEYLATAKELKEILDKVHTIDDVINLRKVGISEKELNSIDIGNCFDDEIPKKLHDMDGDTKVVAIHLNAYVSDNKAQIDDIIYCNLFGDGKQASMSFDVYDGDDVMLEDVDINTFEEAYYKTRVSVEYALEVFDEKHNFELQVDVFLTEEEARAYAKARPLANPDHAVYGITKIYRNGNEDEIGRETSYFDEEDDGPTTFYKVKLLNGFQAELSEVCEHLAMNGYTYDSNCEDSIFIYEDELSYLKTILDDRNLKYEVQ